MCRSIKAFCTYKIKEKDNILMKILYKKKKGFLIMVFIKKSLNIKSMQ